MGKYSKNHSMLESRMLAYISTFDAEVVHISGNKNVIADTLSRPKLQASSIYIDDVITKEEFVKEQKQCEEIKNLQKGHTLSMEIKEVQGVVCDIRHSLCRPVVPQVLRKRVYDQIHNLAHPGAKRTLNLIRMRFVWPNMCKQIKNWAKKWEVAKKKKKKKKKK